MLQIPKTTSSHVRSKSLATGSHPVIVNVEDRLRRLKAQLESTTSSSSSCSTLDDLKKIYECVNDMLQLPLTQQAFSHNVCTEEILEGSLPLLDVCGTVKDVLSQMKGSIKNLESCIRRKRNDITSDVNSFIVSKKKINKVVAKCIQKLKSYETTYPRSILEKDNNNLVAVVSILREVEAVSFSTIKSVLYYLSGTRAASKKNRWSLISKIMMQPKRVSCKTEEDIDMNQVEMVDSLLGTLSKHQLSKDVDMMQNVMKHLEISELAMFELENGIESVFRCLMKTRVSLLNILSH